MTVCLNSGWFRKLPRNRISCLDITHACSEDEAEWSSARDRRIIQTSSRPVVPLPAIRPTGAEPDLLQSFA
jgi:hypothetical protein